MKVFISWSGETSFQVAKALYEWLPYVIQDVKPFLSTDDINKGERWGDVLSKQLESTAYGIICVTPDNVKAPWLNFEAGALSKALDNTLVCPFLFNLAPSRMQGPMAQFESTINEKRDIFKLVMSINARLGDEKKLEPRFLENVFEMWWVKLEESLNKITKTENVENEIEPSWFYGKQKLAKEELAPECKSIWVITPSPLQDLLTHTCVKDIIEMNLARGIVYTVLIPLSEANSIENADALEAYKHIVEQLNIRTVSNKDFHALAPTHFLILNPDEGEKNPLHVFLELPIEQHRDVWIEVENNAAIDFVNRFKRMKEKSKVVQHAVSLQLN